MRALTMMALTMMTKAVMTKGMAQVDHPQAGHLNRLNHPSQGRQPETRIIVIIWSS
jgi:hypothetical protein